MRSMRRVVASAILVALGAIAVTGGFTACEAEKPVVQPLPIVMLPDLQQAGLKQVWQRTLDLRGGEHLNHSWRIGNSIYLTTTEARIFRIDAKSGVLAWTQALGAENATIYRPIEMGPAGKPDEVLVITRGEALVFDYQTGDIRRRSSLGLAVSTDPVVVGNSLLVGGAGQFTALYLDHMGSGRRWRITAGGDLFISTPVVREDDVIVASRSGHLWRVDGETGAWRWKDRRTNGEVNAGLAADGRALYVPGMDQRLYAFNIENGGELWQAQLEGSLESAPIVTPNLVLQVAYGRGLFAVNKQNGQRQWDAPGVNQVGTIIRDHLWAGDEAGNLKSISLSTGQVLSNTLIPEAQLVVLNQQDAEIIVVNRTGAVGGYMEH